jgi:hypothetical protein
MKKITKSWSKRYGSLKIFRDDIEEINGIIISEIEQKDGPDSWRNKLTIEANEFILDGISELVKIKGNYLSTLEFRAGSFELSLSLRTQGAYLKVQNSDNTKLMGIAMRIDAVLQKRLRFIGYFNNGLGHLALFMLSLFLLCFMVVLALIHFNIYLLILLGLITTLGFVGNWYLDHHASKICLCYSHEESNFFVRNKDKILVNIVTAVFSFLLGIIGTLSTQAILAKTKDKAPPTTSQTTPKEVNEISQKQIEK